MPLNKSTTYHRSVRILTKPGGGGMVKLSRNEVKLSKQNFLLKFLQKFSSKFLFTEFYLVATKFYQIP